MARFTAPVPRANRATYRAEAPAPDGLAWPAAGYVDTAPDRGAARLGTATALLARPGAASLSKSYSLSVQRARRGDVGTMPALPKVVNWLKYLVIGRPVSSQVGEQGHCWRRGRLLSSPQSQARLLDRGGTRHAGRRLAPDARWASAGAEAQHPRVLASVVLREPQRGVR